jgi:tetratricopeptide (TPR) repeat protein
MESHSLRLLAVIDHDQGRLENAKEGQLEALAISREIGNQISATMSLNNLGLIAIDQTNYSEAITYFQEGLKTAREIGFRRAEIALVGNLGIFHAEQGDLLVARSYFQQTCKFAQEAEDRASHCNNLGNLGNVSAQLGDLAEAQAHFQEALSICQEIGEKRLQMVTLNSLGMLASQQGKFAQAFDYINKSEILAHELESIDFQAINAVRYARLYDTLGDYQKADEKLAAVSQISEESKGESGVMDTFNDLSLLYHHLNKHDKALQSAKKAYEEALRINDLENQAFASLNIGNAQAALGQSQEAKTAYQQSMVLREKMGQAFRRPEIQAGLLRIALFTNDRAEIEALSNEIYEYLLAHSPDGSYEPLRIYETCYDGLCQMEDPRAAQILEHAYGYLQSRADQISDPALRKSYLQNVSTNRRIQALYSSRQ